MVAVPGGGNGHHFSGSGTVAAMELPTISLRNATAMQFAKWNIAFDNVVIMHNLAQVVADKNPPTREAVEKLYPDKEYGDIDVIHMEF